MIIRKVNTTENTENRWPCMFCDEWSWDVLS